jgi:hypothetical protein
LSDPIFEVYIDAKGRAMFKFLSPFLLNDMLKYKKDFKALEQHAKPGERYIFYPTHFKIHQEASNGTTH